MSWVFRCIYLTSKHALFIRSRAGPEKMPCVRIAYILVAPDSINLFAAITIVPHVSAMSSTNIATLSWDQNNFINWNSFWTITNLGITHQHHSVHFIGLLSLFMNQSELHSESVCYGRHSLGSPGVRTDYDRVPPLGDILLDPLQHRGLCVQIINRDIKESLNLTENKINQLVS